MISSYVLLPLFPRSRWVSFKAVKLGRGIPVPLVRLDRALNDRIDIVLSYSPAGQCED